MTNSDGQQSPGSQSAGDVDDYYDLGHSHRSITTSSAAAQTWFDRGLIWSYGFNHEEAAKCFEHAIAHDPQCAMGYWGLAYALGPNYNKPWELFGRRERQTTAERTHGAIESAMGLTAGDVSTVEGALIDALRHRYPTDKAPGKPEACIWNAAYADAMSAVAARFPDDLDVAALYSDALMNLTPWNLWDIRTGEPARGARTVEVKRVLDRALVQPGGDQHPGILHMYIHLMEMSQTPEAAMPAADKLRGLVPDAGHLNHMPSHLDILVGDYGRAVEANSDAVRADVKFLEREGPLNFYTLYRSHDYHFRLYAALFAGQSKVALETVDMLEASISEELLRVESPPMADWLEAFLAMRVHALIRFGRWRDVLAIRLPEDQDLYCVTTALVYYARGMALAAMGRVEDAVAQRQLFREAVPRVKPSRTLFNNKCVDILCVAEAMLDGEIEYRSCNFDAAFAHLRESIRRYDQLPFDEPWGWMQPARHAYGALLLEQGHVEEALKVYRADLGLDDSLPRVHQHPNNVWALHGYHECLLRLGETEEARRVHPLLQAALARADVPISSSCYCRTVLPKM
ncbi:tetratricopeptide repeat domain-containingprotein [Purpureocillium lavendulum]|uniref:Tetratricopeptide repeat domain-containingprotein n=1 Tax=Purpureocillium lavendulum TaxID=1247861 RepID=A0AB34G733_9HYPO|nr:tetratricopeptide repeat domain-containingprotein [Purpureocillium lavendulum]